MAKKRKRSTPNDEGHETFQADIYQAAKSLRWVVPECEDDVRRAEADLSAGAPPLPESLTDPATVLEGRTAGDRDGARPSLSPPDAQAEQNLARAARKGAKIPPEIEERMCRDRDAAEEEQDARDHGQDVG